MSGWIVPLLIILVLTPTSSTVAGTMTTRVRADTLTARDAHLLAISPTQTFGGAPDLALRTTKRNNKGNVLIEFTPPDLSGRTVLQAWLRLRQFDTDKPKSSLIRVHPLTESWIESQVTWNERSLASPWFTPGGTMSPNWTDRRIASPSTNGTTMSWQVGPILAAQATGAFGVTGNGLLLTSDGSPPDREIRFRSSEYPDTTATPLLEIVSTDEPPAVTTAWAEIQPQRVAEFQSTVLTLSLEADLSGPTPSGSPTGFDLIRIEHLGNIEVTGVVGASVGGVSIAPAAVAFLDDATGCTFQLPQTLTQNGRVVIRFAAQVGVDVTAQEFGLPILIRQSTTGVGFQAAWPANADGISGNGDDWFVTVFSTTTSVHVLSINGAPTAGAGDTGLPFTLRLRNSGSAVVGLDYAGLTFTRSIYGDANAEFSAVAASTAPDTLQPGSDYLLDFLVDVSPDAVTGPVVVNGELVVVDLNSGLAFADLAADTTQTVNITGSTGEIAVSARQSATTVLPGARDLEILSFSLSNTADSPVQLTQLLVDNATAGPGSLAERDGEWESLTLYLDDGDGVFDSGLDTPSASASMILGRAVFSPLTVSVPSEDSLRFFVEADVSVSARDGDALDVMLPADAFTFSPVIPIDSALPLNPTGTFPVNGMAAVQIILHPVPSRTLNPGSTQELLLDVTIPANGYEADVLQRLNVENRGTALAGSELAGLALWADAGNPGFDAAVDRLLGSMSYTGARWEITGLSEAIPPSGFRVYVTADIAPDITQPSTIILAIPSAQDYGIGVASTNSGPLDAAVVNPEPGLVTVRDRITVLANPVPAGTAAPGEPGVILLDLILSNSYTTVRTLNRLVSANLGIGPGTQPELDGNVRVLSLIWDADRDGMVDGTSVDPLLGTAYFAGGRAQFGGFDLTVAPESTERILLTADVSPAATDGDLLSAAILGSLDLEFAETTALAASWPVTSGSAWAVDGMVSGQITVTGSAATTLGPGDGPILAFDFRIPGNGYRADALNGVHLKNLGSAGPADLSEIRLWRDGGNGTFDAGSGDDADLGLFVASGSEWQSLSMSDPIPASGNRLYVAVRVTPGFTGSRDVLLSLPVGGILVASGNDGPLDIAVESGRLLELSDAPLLAGLQISPSPCTDSQSVSVTLTIQNRGTEAVNGIVPSGLGQSGSGSLGPGTGPIPPTLDLGPGASGAFSWTMPALAPGTVTLSASAQGTGGTSGLVRSSQTASSGVHRIFAEATELRLSTLEFMPYSVTIGQGGVVPLNLTFTNPGAAGTSDVTLRSLRIRIEDQAGAGIVPSDLLSRVVVSEGQTVFADKTGIETTGATVDLDLLAPYPPVRVATGDPVTLSLQLHLSASTAVPQFRVLVQDATWISARDAVSDVPVPVVLESGTFPIRTGLANVISEATLIEAQGAPPDTVRVGPGQTGVSLLTMTLENRPGGGSASTVRVGSMGLLFEDGNGTPIVDPAAILSTLELQAAGQTLALGNLPPAAGDSITLLFSSPLTLVEGVPVTLDLVGTVRLEASPGAIRLRLGGGGSLDARDLNTGRAVAVSRVPDPLWGNTVQVENPAETLRLGGSPGFPPAIIVGEKNLVAIAASLEHPGTPGTARIRVESVALAIRDDRGVLLAPASILDRLGLHWNGLPLVEVGTFASTPGLVPLTLPPAFLDPGETVSLDIVLDVETGAPASEFQVTLHGNDLIAADANLNTPIDILPAPGATLPLTSGLTEIRSPSRELWVGLTSTLPAALVADGSEVIGGTATFRNPAPDGSSAIRVRSLRLTAAGAQEQLLPLGSAATRARLVRNGVLWTESALLTPDSTGAWIGFPEELLVLPGKSESLELRLVISPTATASSLRLGFDRGDVGVVQPGGALLAVTLRPESGQRFPLWTETGHFGAMTLRDSYANFPNPFSPRREETSFTYYLPSDGRVTLRIWTLRGEEVSVLLENAIRGAGLHQDDQWNGLNRTGSAVANGVYLAELVVHFDNGSQERLLRKVAVVR